MDEISAIFHQWRAGRRDSCVTSSQAASLYGPFTVDLDLCRRLGHAIEKRGLMASRPPNWIIVTRTKSNWRIVKGVAGVPVADWCIYNVRPAAVLPTAGDREMQLAREWFTGRRKGRKRSMIKEFRHVVSLDHHIPPSNDNDRYRLQRFVDRAASRLVIVAVPGYSWRFRNSIPKKGHRLVVHQAVTVI